MAVIESTQPGKTRFALRASGVLLAYFLSGWLGLQMPYTDPHITLLWLPTGIAVAAILRWGTGVWPGIYLGAMLVNLSIGSSWPLAAAIGVGNVLGPVITAGYLQRAGFHREIDRLRDVVLLVIAAGVGMTVSALGGTASLYLAGVLSSESVVAGLLSWWMGDMVGVLLTAPVLLTLNQNNLKRLIRNRKQLLLWIVIAIPAAWFSFFQDYVQIGRSLPLAFMTLPLIAWAALRFGNTGIGLAVLVFSVSAAWGTSLGHGTFHLPHAYVSMFLLWCYMATTALTGLLIGAQRAEQLRIEQTRRESEAKLRGLFELSPLGIALTDSHGRFVEFNEAFREICGYPADELKQLDYWQLTPEKYGETERAIVDQLERSGRYGPYQKEYVRKDGTLIPLQLNGLLITLNDGQKYVWSIVEDITQRRTIETQMADEAARLSALLETATDGIHILDAAGNVTQFSHSFATMLGYSDKEAARLNVRDWDAHFPRDTLVELIRQMMETPTRFETLHRRKDGSLLDVEIIAKGVCIGGKSFLYASSRDITERKKADAKIENLAFYDPLTHLPNRRLLLDRLQQSLTAATRNGREGALLFLDLDNFKTLNDTLGHDVGDMLLQNVAQRLTHCVRDGDTIARLGGDEFVVMLEDLGDNPTDAANHAEVVGEKIIAALGRQYLFAGHQYQGTVSIGATLFGEHQKPVEELLKQADLAMYQAKAAGRNALRFFDPEMQSAVLVRAALEADMRLGIQQGQFLLHYQPQVDATGKVTGAEALLRWSHPTNGQVSPASFIPLAEETGLILPLGNWVIRTACAQLKAWEAHPTLSQLTLAINVSARQFHHLGFVEEVLTALEQSGANPRKLKLELTESLLLNDVEKTIARMSVLKTTGVGFSLDDFGTGYSSLSYLKRLPLDQLKIDQSFVHDILVDPNDAAIARTILALAGSMGLAVIAEGVETEEQRQRLLDLGCRAFQGYLFSRPLPIEQFGLLLDAR